MKSAVKLLVRLPTPQWARNCCGLAEVPLTGIRCKKANVSAAVVDNDNDDDVVRLIMHAQNVRRHLETAARLCFAANSVLIYPGRERRQRLPEGKESVAPGNKAAVTNTQ